VVLSVEEAQYGARHNDTIMLHMCGLLRLSRVLIVFDTSTLLSGLDLLLHDLLVEAKMALTRENSIANAKALDLGMICTGPDVYLLVVAEQVSGFHGWNCRYLVLMHLVQI
jgi:hypothetical protein